MAITAVPDQRKKCKQYKNLTKTSCGKQYLITFMNRFISKFNSNTILRHYLQRKLSEKRDNLNFGNIYQSDCFNTDLGVGALRLKKLTSMEKGSTMLQAEVGTVFRGYGGKLMWLWLQLSIIRHRMYEKDLPHLGTRSQWIVTWVTK